MGWLAMEGEAGEAIPMSRRVQWTIKWGFHQELTNLR